ncbi:MAG: hypothetical protein ACREQH_05835 [Candidatus Binatus sp.]
MKLGKIAWVAIAIALVACAAPDLNAQTLAQEQTAEDLHDAEAAAKRHRAELMKIPHVRVVTGEIDGQHEAAILVEVDDQKNIDAVTRQLPSKIEGFPVEVDESEGDSPPGNEAAATPTPFPTIDKYGYYHHTWPQPPEPATKPDAPQ